VVARVLAAGVLGLAGADVLGGLAGRLVAALVVLFVQVLGALAHDRAFAIDVLDNLAAEVLARLTVLEMN